MPYPPLTVLVVAYGAPELLAAALASVHGADRVVVVDNGSSSEISRLAREHGAQYVDPGRNAGFAAGVNVGLRALGPGIDVLLLNPDAALDWASAQQLQSELRADVHCAAVAPALRRPDGTSEPVRWPMPTPTLPWWGVVAREPRRSAIFLGGAVLMLRAEALEDVGTFDERFFLYSEEADWQARALDRGWTVRAVEAITATHVGAATSRDRAQRDGYFHASAELLIRKRYGRGGWLVFRAGSVAASARRLLAPGLVDRDVRRTQWRVLKLYVRGPARCLARS